MDKCSCDDDPCSEIPGEEIDIERDVEARDSFGNHREERRGRGYYQDDEQGRDTGAEVAIVLIAGIIEKADDVSWVGS